MPRVWRKKTIPAPRSHPGKRYEDLEAVRRLMDWHPLLDANVAKLARESEPRFTPAFDILETTGYYAFLADVPGIREEDLEITWTLGRITIAGLREPEATGQDADYYALERTFGRFSRAFNLPAGACADRTHATLRDGVLTVLVPKAESVQPGRVPIT